MLRNSLRSILAAAAAVFGALLARRFKRSPARGANWATMRAREDRSALRVYQGQELAELAVQSSRATLPTSNWQQFLTLRQPPAWSAPAEGSLNAMLTSDPGNRRLSAANDNLYDLFGLESNQPQDVVVPMTRRTASKQGGAHA
jgi:hypothetical protein